VEQLGGYLVLAVPVLLLLFLMSRTRRQQRELAQTQAEITVGSRVMTTSGLHAEVTALLDDQIELEIAPGVRTRWVRQAVARIEPPAGVADADEATEPGAPDTPETGPGARP
jgi:preprotein translocase subunit YajC